MSLNKKRPGALHREEKTGNRTGTDFMHTAGAGLKTVLTNRYLIFLLFLFIDTHFMRENGGLMSLLPAWRLEIPLLLYMYFYFNVITRDSKFQPLVTAVPIVLLYGVFDAYHMQLGQLLRLTEVAELPELFLVTPIWIKIVLALVFGLPFIAFFRLLRIRRIPVMVLGILPLICLVMTAEFAPEFFITAFKKTQKSIITYSDIMSAGNNGRILTMLYNEAWRKTFSQKIANYKGNAAFINEFEHIAEQLRSRKTKNNVHLVVLESFLDPELLRGAVFSRNPMHPKFKNLFKKKGSLSISPVFGGGTGQAEFEVLCGVPALRELSNVEFDSFSGSRTFSLPNLLLKGGYHTIATNAFVPNFFNSVNAYHGLGFEKTYYPGEYASGRETYLSTGDVTDEKYMFDGDLFKQNLAFISQWMSSNPGVPLFNYIMTIYGHTPNRLDTTKRPKIIEVKGAIKDDQLERAVNQYYYRTEAIADFINGIQAIDPKSLVILVSDHIPPLAHGPTTYKKLNYINDNNDFMHINRIFFFENGRAVQYRTIHHYDIPSIILNYITNGNYCKNHVCNFKARSNPIKKEDYHEAYMTIMVKAMNL